VLKQAGVKYRDLRYLDYGDTIDDSNFNDDPYDRLHSYKTIVDAIKNLEDISGQGDYVDLDRFFVK
jgi:hypothetical protein